MWIVSALYIYIVLYWESKSKPLVQLNNYYEVLSSIQMSPFKRAFRFKPKNILTQIYSSHVYYVCYQIYAYLKQMTHKRS